MEPVPPTVTPPTPIITPTVVRSDSPFLIIFLTIAFLIALTAAAYFFIQTQSLQARIDTLTAIQPSPVPTPTATAAPTPTCRPRPACLDATPRCLIPETDDMCPPPAPKGLTCPESGWVDCMPVLDAAQEKNCSVAAMDWYKQNCLNFQGVAL